MKNIDQFKSKITFDQVDYATSIVNEYKKDIGKDENVKLRYVSTPGMDYLPEGIDLEQEGVFSDRCAKCIGKLMYLHRGSRFDITQVVARESRYLTKWKKLDDAKLHRLMQYLDNHLEYAAVATVDSRDLGSVRYELYVDADHAGEAMDSKSTGGAFHVLVGDHGTWFPLEWASKKQGVTAHSSAESELVALCDHTKVVLKHYEVTDALSRYRKDKQHEPQ